MLENILLIFIILEVSNGRFNEIKEKLLENILLISIELLVSNEEMSK